MNSRIYSEEMYREEIERLKLNYYHCPVCFGNSLSNVIGNLQLFENYHCKNCQHLFNKSEALTKDKVRGIKIDKILK